MSTGHLHTSIHRLNFGTRRRNMIASHYYGGGSLVWRILPSIFSAQSHRNAGHILMASHPRALYMYKRISVGISYKFSPNVGSFYRITLVYHTEICIYRHHGVNSIAIDALATKGARSSTAMTLPMSHKWLPVFREEGFLNNMYPISISQNDGWCRYISDFFPQNIKVAS